MPASSMLPVPDLQDHRAIQHTSVLKKTDKNFKK